MVNVVGITTSTSNINISVPVGVQAGDLLLLGRAAGTTITGGIQALNPASFSVYLYGTANAPTSSTQEFLAGSVVSGTVPTTITYPVSANTNVASTLVALRNVSKTHSFDIPSIPSTFQTGSLSGTAFQFAPSGSITTVTPQTFLFSFATKRRVVDTISAPSGWTFGTSISTTNGTVANSVVISYREVGGTTTTLTNNNLYSYGTSGAGEHNYILLPFRDASSTATLNTKPLSTTSTFGTGVTNTFIWNAGRTSSSLLSDYTDGTSTSLFTKAEDFIVMARFGTATLSTRTLTGYSLISGGTGLVGSGAGLGGEYLMYQSDPLLRSPLENRLNTTSENLTGAIYLTFRNAGTALLSASTSSGTSTNILPPSIFIGNNAGYVVTAAFVENHGTALTKPSNADFIKGTAINVAGTTQDYALAFAVTNGSAITPFTVFQPDAFGGVLNAQPWVCKTFFVEGTVPTSYSLKNQGFPEIIGSNTAYAIGTGMTAPLNITSGDLLIYAQSALPSTNSGNNAIYSLAAPPGFVSFSSASAGTVLSSGTVIPGYNLSYKYVTNPVTDIYIGGDIPRQMLGQVVAVRNASGGTTVADFLQGTVSTVTKLQGYPTLPELNPISKSLALGFVFSAADSELFGLTNGITNPALSNWISIDRGVTNSSNTSTQKTVVQTYPFGSASTYSYYQYAGYNNVYIPPISSRNEITYGFAYRWDDSQARGKQGVSFLINPKTNNIPTNKIVWKVETQTDGINWDDITSYVRGLKIETGKQPDNDTPEVGVAEIQLYNQNDRFTIGKTNSGYTGSGVINFIPDGSFESGTTSNTTFCNGVINKEFAYSGTYSLNIGNNKKVSWDVDLFAIEKTQYYSSDSDINVSFWAYSPADTGIAVKISPQENTKFPVWQSPESFTYDFTQIFYVPAYTWKQIKLSKKLVFLLEKNYGSKLTVEIAQNGNTHGGISSGNLYIDDVMLLISNSSKNFFDGEGYQTRWLPFDTSTQRLFGNGIVGNGQSEELNRSLEKTRTNVSFNPSFENGTAFWSGTASTLSSSTAWASSGTASLRIVPSSSSNTSFASLSNTFTNEPYLFVGSTYTVSADINTPIVQTGSLNANARRIRIRNFNGFGGYLASSTAGPTSGTARISLTYTMPAVLGGTEFVINPFIELWNGGTVGSGDVYWDSVLIEEANTLETYFDGNTSALSTAVFSDYKWLGDADASASQKIVDKPFEIGTKIRISAKYQDKDYKTKFVGFIRGHDSNYVVGQPPIVTFMCSDILENLDKTTPDYIGYEKSLVSNPAQVYFPCNDYFITAQGTPTTFIAPDYKNIKTGFAPYIWSANFYFSQLGWDNVANFDIYSPRSVVFRDDPIDASLDASLRFTSGSTDTTMAYYSYAFNGNLRDPNGTAYPSYGFPVPGASFNAWFKINNFGAGGITLFDIYDQPRDVNPAFATDVERRTVLRVKVGSDGTINFQTQHPSTGAYTTTNSTTSGLLESGVGYNINFGWDARDLTGGGLFTPIYYLKINDVLITELQDLVSQVNKYALPLEPSGFMGLRFIADVNCSLNVSSIAILGSSYTDWNFYDDSKYISRIEPRTTRGFSTSSLTTVEGNFDSKTWNYRTTPELLRLFGVPIYIPTTKDYTQLDQKRIPQKGTLGFGDNMYVRNTSGWKGSNSRDFYLRPIFDTYFSNIYQSGNLQIGNYTSSKLNLLNDIAKTLGGFAYVDYINERIIIADRFWLNEYLLLKQWIFDDKPSGDDISFSSSQLLRNSDLVKNQITLSVPQRYNLGSKEATDDPTFFAATNPNSIKRYGVRDDSYSLYNVYANFNRDFVGWSASTNAKVSSRIPEVAVSEFHDNGDRLIIESDLYQGAIVKRTISPTNVIEEEARIDKIVIEATPTGTTATFAFTDMTDAKIGRLDYLKIDSGKLGY